MKLKIKKLSEEAIIPTRGTEFSAGLDIYSPTEVVIRGGGDILLGSLLAFEIPVGYAGLVYARSGLSVKHGIIMKNSVGVIDSDYRGEVKLALMNVSGEDYLIKKGERVAQIIITPYLHCDILESDELSDSVRGEGGFGSTGKVGVVI